MNPRPKQIQHSIYARVPRLNLASRYVRGRAHRKACSRFVRCPDAQLSGFRQSPANSAYPPSRNQRLSVGALGSKTRQPFRTHCSHLGFCSFFYEANEHPRRATGPPRAPSKPSRPHENGDLHCSKKSELCGEKFRFEGRRRRVKGEGRRRRASSLALGTSPLVLRPWP